MITLGQTLRDTKWLISESKDIQSVSDELRQLHDKDPKAYEKIQNVFYTFDVKFPSPAANDIIDGVRNGKHDEWIKILVALLKPRRITLTDYHLTNKGIIKSYYIFESVIDLITYVPFEGYYPSNDTSDTVDMDNVEEEFARWRDEANKILERLPHSEYSVGHHKQEMLQHIKDPNSFVRKAPWGNEDILYYFDLVSGITAEEWDNMRDAVIDVQAVNDGPYDSPLTSVPLELYFALSPRTRKDIWNKMQKWLV